jgi:hypothetical protein
METSSRDGRLAVLYGLPFLVAAGLSFVMLETDKNLQTDFGTVSSGYFVHWYLVLAMGVVDLVGAGLLLAWRKRWLVKIGVIASGLFALALVGAVATYQQVGFSSAMQFADYLFGVTYYGGDIRYLYDALLGWYVATCIGGLVGLWATRGPKSAAPSVTAAANTPN